MEGCLDSPSALTKFLLIEFGFATYVSFSREYASESPMVVNWLKRRSFKCNLANQLI